MLALALDDNYGSNRLFVTPLLNDEIRINFISLVSLDCETVGPDEITVPPKNLGMFIKASATEPLPPLIAAVTMPDEAISTNWKSRSYFGYSRASSANHGTAMAMLGADCRPTSFSAAGIDGTRVQRMTN